MTTPLVASVGWTVSHWFYRIDRTRWRGLSEDARGAAIAEARAWLARAAGEEGLQLGLATMGYKVIATIGKEITEITPTRGFCAEFGAATTVLFASSLGLPISTTHTLVGAVIGVGFARGIGALNMRVIRNIANSWLATVPVSAGVAAILFLAVRAVVF